MNIFDINSPIMQKLSRLGDMILLNLLTLLCSLPLITIGAAISALYEAMDKHNNWEGTTVHNYFSAFCSNFRKATLLWLILLPVGMLFLFSLFWNMMNTTEFGQALQAMAFLGFILWAIVLTWAFPLQAKFENSVGRTLRNAFVLSIAHFLRSLVMAVMNLVPWLLLWAATEIFLRLMPLWLLGWFSIAAWVNLGLLKKPYMGLVEEIPAEEAD